MPSTVIYISHWKYFLPARGAYIPLGNTKIMYTSLTGESSRLMAGNTYYHFIHFLSHVILMQR